MSEKVWTKDEVTDNLKKHDIWVIRGVSAIYKYQTEAEKLVEDTQEHNGVGFNGVDGHIMSSFAKQIENWNGKESKFNKPLSRKQMLIARKKIMKYAGQLTKIANGEM